MLFRSIIFPNALILICNGSAIKRGIPMHCFFFVFWDFGRDTCYPGIFLRVYLLVRQGCVCVRPPNVFFQCTDSLFQRLQTHAVLPAQSLPASIILSYMGIFPMFYAVYLSPAKARAVFRKRPIDRPCGDSPTPPCAKPSQKAQATDRKHFFTIDKCWERSKIKN